MRKRFLPPQGGAFGMLKLMPKKAWSFTEHEFLGLFSLLSVFSTAIHPMSWKMMMTESIRKPQYVGQYAHGRRPFRVWLYKTRVWISDHQVTMAAFEKQGKRIRPRYVPEEQWWWDSIDESMREHYLGWSAKGWASNRAFVRRRRDDTLAVSEPRTAAISRNG